MASLWFVVPAAGRVDLARICMRQLRRTCNTLTDVGVEATAVVIADDENLDTALELGFGTVRHNNEFVSRKFNAGIQAALDPAHNERPADYVVPCGSDDWVDWRLFTTLPDPNTVEGFQRMSFVREDGRHIVTKNLTNEGGSGIRIIPAALLKRHSPPTHKDPWNNYRPCAEDRGRGCDTSILNNLRAHWGDTMQVRHLHLHDFQIVDWKSPGTQLNSYDSLRRWRTVGKSDDPFATLADHYPAEALEEMQAHYGVRELAAA